MSLDPVSLALQGAQSVFGIAQLIKGKNMAKKNVRPTYEIPNEIKDNLSQAQMQAMEGLPEEQKNQYIQNLQRSSNFALSGMSDRKGGLAGLGGLVQNQNDAYGNLLSADAQAKRQNQQNLMQQRNTMAEYKDKAFQTNQMDPYSEKLAQSQAMKGAGLQNIFGGLSSAVTGMQNKNMFDQLGADGEPTMNQFQMARQKKANQGLQSMVSKPQISQITGY